MVADSRILLGIPASVFAATAVAAQLRADQPTPKPIPRAQFIASMDAEFSKMDADKNGHVTLAEMDEFNRVKAEAAALARIRAQFAELDTNKNGQLSAAEFAKLAQPPVMTSGAPTLTAMDRNRDQQLSLIEYRYATLANFDRLDTDRNGLVTPAEMEAGGITLR